MQSDEVQEENAKGQKQEALYKKSYGGTAK
jgi:hypothetical protein